MIGKEPCPCGNRSCNKWFLTGIGHFVQGSGFTEAEADRIIGALSLPEGDIDKMTRELLALEE